MLPFCDRYQAPLYRVLLISNIHNSKSLLIFTVASFSSVDITYPQDERTGTNTKTQLIKCMSGDIFLDAQKEKNVWDSAVTCLDNKNQPTDDPPS